jgi:hypothetical protein
MSSAPERQIMALQTQDLVMVGLGIQADHPPSTLQPPLVDGIHLRWAFRPNLGFPWYGFHLFRREHMKQGDPICLSPTLSGFALGQFPAVWLTTSAGTVSSDTNLVISNDFPPAGARQFDLDLRAYLSVLLPEPAHQADVHIGFRDSAEVAVAAQAWGVPVVKATASGKKGQIVTVRLEFDTITEIKLGPGPAALLDVCVIPVSRNALDGWETVPNFSYPMPLPVRHPNYPCTLGQPTNEPASEAVAMGRVLYGSPSVWAGSNFSALHGELVQLVSGGPSGTPMSAIATPVAGVAVPPDPQATPPRIPAQYPLQLVLLSTLHPAAAQMLALYWADRQVVPNQAYDYLIVADYSGRLPREGPASLSLIRRLGFIPANGYIVFNQTMKPQPAIEAPQNLRAYSLPGGTIRRQGGGLIDSSNNAGLRWELNTTDLGILLPGNPIMFHLSRADLGQNDPPGPPPASQYKLLTDGHPVLVAEPSSPYPLLQRAPDWPPFSLHAIDQQLQDGWYSYRVSGIDIFGRYTANSTPAPWYQWTPEPAPRPWYYQDPPSDSAVHPFAVHLLDKIGPPCPTGVEAYALDPRDPTVVRDAAFKAWWATLSASEQTSVIGLRVRWQWTEMLARQAPDTREFRIYYNPGSAPPKPDDTVSTNWAERIYVVDFNEHVAVAVDAAGRPVRRYELFLPAPGAAFRGGLALTVSLTQVISYANIGVSAADDKTHTADDPRWPAPWGGRVGNEGPVGAPVKVFVVLRILPSPPVPPPDSERVYATAADYHSRSYYTFRWRPAANLKTHLFRALDDGVFQADWLQHPRPPLDASQLQFFPDASVEPRWDALKRQQVSAELNRLNSFGSWAQALPYYLGLSNDGLRVLAGLPGTEKVFSQLTIQPLDPNDPANANRLGPDNASNFPIDPNLRATTDTLDGRATNRYFYRSCYIDQAGNRSALSLCGPPVWLPDVTPPRPPTWTKVLGGDRRIVLRWASNREADLAQYRIYRTDTPDSARDPRLMTLVHTENVAAGDPKSRPAEVVWIDTPVPGLVNFSYLMVAVDQSGNVSTPSPVVIGRAFDEALPVAPPLIVTWTADVPPAARAAWTANDKSRLERRAVTTAAWDAVTDWLSPGGHSVDDPVAATIPWYYRVRVRKATGAEAVGQRVGLPRQ